MKILNKTFNKIVKYKNNEVTILETIFLYQDNEKPFYGVTGYVFNILSKLQYDNTYQPDDCLKFPKRELYTNLVRSELNLSENECYYITFVKSGRCINEKFKVNMNKDFQKIITIFESDNKNVNDLLKFFKN